MSVDPPTRHDRSAAGSTIGPSHSRVTAMPNAMVQKALTRLRRDDLPKSLYWLTFRAINAVAICKVLRGVFVGRADPKFLQCPAPLVPMLLTEERLREFARDPDNQMSEAFIDHALARG